MVMTFDNLQRQVTVIETGLIISAILLALLAIAGWMTALKEAKQLDRTCRFALAYQSPEMRALVLRANPWCPKETP